MTEITSTRTYLIQIESDAKLKAGIFVGPEIRKLMLNEEFDSRFNPVELAAWNALKSVVANFLGNHRHEQNADMVMTS